MNVLDYPEGIKAKDVQVWNNAAFDNGESEDSSTLKPLFINPFESSDSFSSKENQIPYLEEINSSVSVSSVNTPGPLKRISSNGVVENSKIKASKFHSKQDFTNEGGLCSGKGIDKEIEEIEMEINRLASRLEALRIEKAEKNVKMIEKRVRAVPAKFMESKQENSLASAKMKVNRRGLSLGPAEIFAGSRRRGMSLGPSEIVTGIKSGQLRKQAMLTPVQPMQSRGKSCFWKLHEIDEEKASKSSSSSPKTRKGITKNQVTRQAVTTIGSKKSTRKDEVLLNSVQPKKLFRDGEKSSKKPIRPGRFVPSRYNQGLNQASEIRKRSLPENDKDDESKRFDKKRSLSVGKTRANVLENKNVGSESRVKKRWEIPSEIIVHGNYEDQKSPSVMHNMLPMLRITRRIKESPRDSGQAKRVAELVGRKSFFSNDEEEESSSSVCQALSFDEEALE